MYYNTGDRYEGDFKNDLKNGKGIIYYKNGGRYEGDFKNNLRDGKGLDFYLMVIDLKVILKKV